jgi:predicted DNA-binding WGR domain protein
MIKVMKKYFEYTDEVSNKFWQINLKGKQVALTYGRIGIKNPAQIVKKFKGKSASEDAKKFALTKIREKTNKGYIEK